MKLEVFSRYYSFAIILLCCSFTQTFAQPNIYIFGMGGGNYIPMKNFAHFLNELPNHKIDEIGFNGSVGIKYAPSANHIFLISSEIINKNASFSGGFLGATWNFNVIPIAIGYQYLFSNEESNFRPFTGINISYSFIEIEGEYYSDTPPTPNDFTKRNKFGIEPNFGFNYKLVERFFLVTEIKYRYMSDIEFWGKDVNLSGLIVNAGFQFGLL
ncbi:MAG: hypothetical protein K9J12_00350 [Melioribacteraceae bacterium]|nr:hypothetical protein [Melioribacteraceae bacterium]MCF8264351.1 hypothetical protein [Melioribacteraceae bacterium]MCF8432516.1 hypothetical protein [Melioribacteraceae bacterium]